MADLTDFSSLNPAEEKAFVPFERVMRENSKRAYTIGFGIAGVVFVIVSAVVLSMYTPCTRFCERPPSTCTKDADIAAFKQNCWNSCRTLEREGKQPLKREVKVNPADEKSKETKVVEESVSGTEFVENLAACAFGGGAGLTCEGVTKIAEGRGLWCHKE